MSDFCWLLARLAFLAMFIGMVKPKLVIFWGNKAGKDAQEGFCRLSVRHRARNSACHRDASGRLGRGLGLVFGRRYR